MDGSDLPSAVSGGIVEGVLGDGAGLVSGDDLETLYDARHALVLQPTVLSLCVLTNHNYVDVSVSGRKRMKGFSLCCWSVWDYPIKAFA